MSEYDFYQIDHVGVDESDRTAARTDKGVVIRRAKDTKISNFGAGNVGSRMATDLTRTVLDFEAKDELSAVDVITEDSGFGSNVPGRSTNVDRNPYIAGSSVKRVRDEQAFRLGMADNRGVSISEPDFDVMADNTIRTSSMNAVAVAAMAGKNWPTEGYRSFGGKYDFEPYTGGGIH